MSKDEIKRGWTSNPAGEIIFDEIIDDYNILKALLGNENLKCEGIIGFIMKDNKKHGYYKAIVIAQVKGIKKELIIKVENISFDFMKKLKRDFKLE